MPTAEAVADKVARVSRRASDPLELMRDVAAVVRPIVGFDQWCGLLMDPSTLLNTGGYHEEGFPFEHMPRLLEIEYGVGDVNAFPSLARLPAGVSTLERATEGDRSGSPRFRDVLAPSGCGQELRAVVRDRGGSTWGAFTLFRPTADRDFTDEQCRFMSTVAVDIATGLRRTMLVTEAARRDLPDGPGLAVVRVDGARLEIETASRAALRWMEDIQDGRLTPSQLPLAVATLSHRALGDPSTPARSQVRGASGQWITLHVEAVPDDPPDAAGRRVTVIVEPTRPHELAEIIAAAYGLSARERQVARLAVAGYANREIGTALHLSHYTIGDHLKAIFSKLDVSSRAELTARMFFDQYLPRTVDGLPLGGDGWYITDQHSSGDGRRS